MYSSETGILSVVLVVFIKLLIVIFVISLLIGLFIVAKNYLFNARDIAAFKSAFAPVVKTKKTCSTCGKTLENEWKVCPYCATEETIN